MGYSVYKKTATKAKNGKIYAFGRKSELNGKDKALGGYVVYVVKANYNGQIRGGLDKRWVSVEGDLSYSDAVALMNRRCGYKAFEE